MYEKVVLDGEKLRDGCFGCRFCQDTGFSWICEKTQEKLEGYDSMTDKISRNNENFLNRNIMVTIGDKCPFCVVTKLRTPIKFNVSLETIAEFVDNETCDVYIDTDDIEDGKLRIGVCWFEGGYPDDDIHRDYVLDELYEVERKIARKFNCKMEEIDDYEREEIIITL